MFKLEKGQKIFLVGIGGAGMTALAYFLRGAGYEVEGSDVLVSQNVEKLERDGFKVYKGHFADNIRNSKLLIYSSAIGKDNPEITAAKAFGIKTYERGVALKTISKEFERLTAVSGTHGKTTCATLIFYIFRTAGLLPSSLIGGDFDGSSGGAFCGGKHLVCEACEYAENFLYLRPHTAVILNIDNDHLECYKTEKRLKKAFEKFSKRSKKTVVWSGIKGIKVKNPVTFGFKVSDKYRAGSIFEKDGCCSFKLYVSGRFTEHFNLKIPGKHNVLNALAAIAAAREEGIDISVIKKAVESFKGAKRRFEKVYENDSFALFDDYAHHPAEIETVISAARAKKYPFVTLVFQPFTYSRTKLLLDNFKRVLKKADSVIVCPVMGGREKNIYGVSSLDIVKGLDNAVYANNFKEAAERAIKCTRKGGCIMTVGCGNVYEAGKIIVSDSVKSE